MQISVNDYVALMEKKDFFSEHQLIPELNSQVWKEFLKLTQKYVPEINAGWIYWIDDKYGFSYNPFGDFENLEWALCSYHCHSYLPFNTDEIVNDSAKIMEGLATHVARVVIKTDTFIPIDYQHEDNYSKHLLWLNSPVVSIPAQYDQYLTSLTSSRRNKIKKVMTEYAGKPIQSQLSFEPLMTNELEFALANLAQKWKSDLNYALAQLLWTMAVSSVMPKNVFWLRVYAHDKLIALSHYIIKNDVLYHQGIVKDEMAAFNNIGTFCFVETIKSLCGTQYTHLDPTCKTSLIETESIEGYKRSVVNVDAIKPIYIAHDQIEEQMLDVPMPFYSAKNGWVIAEDKIIMLKGV